MDRTPPIDSDKYLHFGFTSNYNEVTRRRTFNRHNEVEVSVVEKGRVDFLLGRQLVRMQPGQFTVYWGAIPHAPVRATTGTMIHWMTLPLTWVLEWKLPGNFIQIIMSGKAIMEPDDQHGRADLTLFSRWHDDLKDGSAERKKLVLLECEARLRRLLLSARLSANRHARASTIGRNPSKVERMSRFVALHYTEPLRIADIAKDAGLHPDYAATLFRETCGLGLVDYVTEHRVSHAQRLLATADSKITEISFVAGFGSMSRFYSAFKKACGRTPRQYRHEMSLSRTSN